MAVTEEQSRGRREAGRIIGSILPWSGRAIMNNSTTTEMGIGETGTKEQMGGCVLWVRIWVRGESKSMVIWGV